MLRVELMARPHPLPLLTTVSRLKTIVSFVERTEGEEAARALLADLSVSPELLADETRPLPLATLQAALVWLSLRSRKEAILEMTQDVLDPQNLGVFAPLLRSSSSIDEALRRIQPLSLGLRFEIVSTGPGLFHGRLELDPSMELIRLAIAAELAAIPLFYGRGRARVEIRDPGEFIVRWREPSLLAAPLLAAASTLFAAFIFANYEIAMTRALLPGIALLFGLAAWAWTRERLRRLDSHAQLLRIQVLERGILLAELRREASFGAREGSVIAGEYLVEERLGAGANGVIYRARRLADLTTVAMKLLRTGAADDPVAADRLGREAEALALSRHPNVVELFEHHLLQDGTAYLVLEHLEGESLATRLEREGALSAEELAPLALELSDALIAVHAACVVHRDIKPSNVFLARDRDGQIAIKLFDFGIAYVEWAETRLTDLGNPLGTPGYMSPEQARGERVSARSDLFSLGVLLHECLTGRRPGEAGDEPPPSRDRPSGVERAAPAIPPAWREIIERATAPLPEERFADARRMREAIVAASILEIREAN